MVGKALAELPIVDEAYFAQHSWMDAAQRKMAAVRLNAKTVVMFGDLEAIGTLTRDLTDAFGREGMQELMDQAHAAMDRDLHLYGLTGREELEVA